MALPPIRPALSEMTATEYEWAQEGYDEIVLRLPDRMFELAYALPSTTRTGEQNAFCGYIDYKVAATIRELTRGEG